MKQAREGTAYLILEEGRYPNELRIVQSRSKRPNLNKNQLAIKVKVRIPHSAFEDLLPTATIDIPEDSIIPPTIELEAEMEDEVEP